MAYLFEEDFGKPTRVDDFLARMEDLETDDDCEELEPFLGRYVHGVPELME